MRAVLHHLVALAVLLGPFPAAPQAPAFSTTPLRVGVPAGAAISLAPWSVPWTAARPPPYPSNDLFVYPSGGQAVQRRAWRSLAVLAPAEFGASPNPATCAAAGLLNETAGDGLADVAYCSFNGPTSGLYVFFGDAPLGPFFGTLAPPATGFASTLATAHLLDTRRDVVVAGDLNPSPNTLTAVDFGGTGSAPLQAGSVTWTHPTCCASGDDALLPVRLSAAALGPARVHDVARSRSPGVDVLWNLGPATTLSAPGFQVVHVGLGWEVRGAAALDVDFDGIPDLVACLYSSFGPPPAPPQLVWVKNNESPAALPTNPRGDLGALLGISLARLCRPLDLDGVPAVALWDAAADEIVVVTSDIATQRLLTWRGSTLGRIPIDIMAGDVVGSPLADLVVAYAGAGGVDVFPDAGDQLPDLAWVKVPPATAIRGRDLALEVTASDPDGQVEHVEWFRDGATTAAATATAPPFAFTIPGQSLCGLPGPVAILVRATDDVGLYRELQATVSLVDGPPLLSLAGAGGALAVPLVPGGTSVVLDAGVSGGCGATTLDWTPPPGLLAAGATARREDVAGGARLIVDVPEASYPAILAQPSLAFPAEVRATDVGGTASASVSIELDPGGLVAVEQTSDRTALAPGDLALLTATVRSAVSVTLPAVLLDDRLEGLEPAGPARVVGADAAPATRTESGVGVVLDLPGGRPIAVEIPVRRTLARAGASRVRAVAPASGAALSAEARVDATRTTLPGCGCGGDGGTTVPGILLLALYVNAMRRVLARTRSTSSRTFMRRQA